MCHSRRWLLVIGLHVVGGLLLPLSPIGATDYVVLDGWDHQIYPSYIIAAASIKDADDDADADTDETETEQAEGDDADLDDADDDQQDEDVTYELIGDSYGVLGIEIVSPSDHCRLTLTIAADDWLLPSTSSVELPEAGVTYRVMPKVRYRYAELAKNHQTVPSTVSFDVTIQGQPLESKTSTVVLHSINDCPFAYVDGDYQYDVGFVFASYVNEQHPFVDKILRESLDSEIVDSFSGYQSGDPAQTLLQVYAIWHALTERDLRYSSITAVAGVSDAVDSQHVRLIDESINNAQANCVDGSVLLASLLRKIDIEPYLVMVPGHCYLAFSLDPEGETILGLETTLLGEVDAQYESIEELEELLYEESLDSTSYASFCAALAVGTQGLSEHVSEFQDEDQTDYQLISIRQARADGILPIAFHSRQRFEAAQ